MSKPILVVMIGISGSGKSTFARGLKTSLGAEVVSTDDIRLEITGDATDQTRNGEVFGIARKRIDDLLAQGKNAVIDATSLSQKDRRLWIDIGKKHGAEVLAYVVNRSVDVAKQQNLKRTRQVPDWVIDKQKSKFQLPTSAEGFDKIVNV